MASSISGHPEGTSISTEEHLNKVSACRRRVFTTEEDRYLTEIVTSKECANWLEIAQKLPGRTARQCRDRWVNYLSPSNSFEPWTREEDELIVQKVNELGTKWAQISKFIPGRSDNTIKNRWYSGLKNQCILGPNGRYILMSAISMKLVKQGNMIPQRWPTLSPYQIPVAMPMLPGYWMNPVVFQMQTIQTPQKHTATVHTQKNPVPEPASLEEESVKDEIWDRQIISHLDEISQDPFGDAFELFAGW